MEKAINELKKAMGMLEASHPNWDVLAGKNRPVNGVYEVKGKPYKAK